MVRLSEDFHQTSETTMGIGPGDLLGDQYEVGELLGRGGMGAVYRARDRLLDRTVALKVLPAFLGDSPRAREGLRKEAARAIELSHPSLARIYHFGLHQGQPFLVMEFVAGRTLADLLEEERPLPLERALAILRPLSDALDYAHARRLVHRDVKPGNILLREDTEEPVLIDFGIAGELRDQSTRTGHTAAGSTTGTLSYMSPEQVRGAPPTPAMDLYSLAAVAYEMLGGDPPFFRGDPLNVQYQIVHEPPPGIPDLGEELMDSLLQGLAKQPEDRPGSGRALVAMLAGEPPPSEPPGARSSFLGAPPSLPPPRESGVRASPKASGSMPSQDPEPPPEVAIPEDVRLHLLLGPLLGFFFGAVPGALGTGFWNVLAVPSLQQTSQFQEALRSPHWLLFTHLLPPLIIGAVPFALLVGVFARWLEERRTRSGLPFLMGVGLGVFLASFSMVNLLPVARGELPLGAIALVLVGLFSMFLILGSGLVMLPESCGLEKEELGTFAWWGWRLSLMLLPPFFVGLTGSVIGRAMPIPGSQLLLDQLAPIWDQHLLYPFSVHFLPWVVVVTPAMTILARLGARFLEKKYPGTGFPLVIGLTLALATNGVLCWVLGWFDPMARSDNQDIRFFVTSVLLALGYGCIQILWAGREQLFDRRVPPWLFALTVWSTRMVCDFLTYLVVLEALGGGVWLRTLLGGLAPTSRFLLLAILVLPYALATTALLAHLFGDTPPRDDPRLGDQLVAESLVISPLLLWLICRTHPQAISALELWWPLLYGSALATLPGILLGLAGLRRWNGGGAPIAGATEEAPEEPGPR